MSEEATANVQPELCRLRHEVIEVKIAACDKRIDGILTEIQGVRDLQKTILYTLVAIGFGTGLTLLGVLAGRAIDFGIFF